MLAGGRGVLGVYYLLGNIIHCITANLKGGGDSSQGGEDSPSPPPPPRKYPAVIVSSKFRRGFFSGSEKMC